MDQDNPYQPPTAPITPDRSPDALSGTGIRGLDGLTHEEMMRELQAGGRFVVYPYCISILVMTFQRNSGIYFLRGGEIAAVKGIPWILLSMVAGWWGFPWGLFFTPAAIMQNLFGGKNVTNLVLGHTEPPTEPDPDF